MSLPFNLPIGRVLNHLHRKIQFDGDLGDGYLKFVDCRTGAVVRVPDENTGQLVLPSIAWVREELIAGRLLDPIAREKASPRAAKIVNLDLSACEEMDPVSVLRSRWVQAAVKEGVAKTDAAYRTLIERLAAQKDWTNHKPPAASTLRGWVRRWNSGERRTNDLVSLAGRARGSSQLSSLDDELVQEAAIYYWAEPNAKIRDAEAYLWDQRNHFVAKGLVDPTSKCPTYETIRLRVHATTTFATHCTKWGLSSAEKMYRGSGDSVPATRIFERIYMDGTEFEQATVFAYDWLLGAAKLKGVFGVDAFSTYIFRPAIFAGPYRQEASIKALANIMMPPELSSDELKEDEWRGWVFGIPKLICTDNDRTLIGPHLVASILELGCVMELAPVFASNARALDECLNGYIKGGLSGLPGTIHGPRQLKDVRRDPIAEASLTGGQFQVIVNARIFEWNTSPRAELGGRSPLDLMREGMEAGHGPSLTDPCIVRRALSNTVPNRVLTGNGVEYDGIRYRGGAAIDDFLRRNYRDTPIGKRNEHTAKCIVSIRTYEGDLDSIDIYDDESRNFITLHSTDREYTGMLTRWEHAQYKEYAKKRDLKFETKEERLRARALYLRTIDETAPDVPFRRRAVMAAIYENHETRRIFANKRRVNRSEPLNDGRFIAPATEIRTDAPLPPPGPKNGDKPAVRIAPPARPDGYYEGRIAGIASTPPGTIDWNLVDDRSRSPEISSAKDKGIAPETSSLDSGNVIHPAVYDGVVANGSGDDDIDDGL